MTNVSWNSIQEKFLIAVANNALFSIDTKINIITDRGVDFVIRVAKAFQNKPVLNDQKHLINSKSPFLPPYDPYLYVGSISDTHILIFNKFNVLPYHLLLVTKEYQSQYEGLNVTDFEGSYKLLQEKEGLIFFNCGPVSGHSVLHKHLQFVPLPLTSIDSVLVPIEKLIYYNNVLPTLNTVFTIKQIPFKHSCLVFSNQLPKEHTEEITTLPSPQQLHQYCAELLKSLNIPIQNADAETINISYNFLLTRRWMFVVLRKLEKFNNIPINGLGFTGSLFIKEESDLQLVGELGPFSVLKGVGFPCEED